MRSGRNRFGGKSGQAIIFLMVVLVVGLFVVLWNFDLHNTVSTKIRVGNAGDAAALSAARWQGITMNMVGELNLMQAAVLLEDPLSAANIESASEITELRTRISLNGPLIGYISSQAAGFMNLKEKDIDRIASDESARLGGRAQEFMNTQSGLYRGRVPPAYNNAWFEYGSLLGAIAEGDMLVASANTKYYLFYDGSHTLLNPYFYHAIASSYWCWFAEGNRDLLTSYSDYGSWPALPPISERPAINSEYFSTEMKAVDTVLWDEIVDTYRRGVAGGVIATNGSPGYAEQIRTYLLNQQDASRDTNPFSDIFEGVDPDLLDQNYVIMMLTNQTDYSWHFYNERSWSYGGFMDAHEELFDGITIKPEFDYTGGADAAVNVYLEPFNITPGMQIDYNDIYWPAAAKPFGWLDVSDGSRDKQVPHYFGIVLPAWRQSRLIRNDISTRPQGVSEPRWDEHIYEHLPDYIAGGLDAIKDNGCYWCSQLETWEQPEFRNAGDTWLRAHHDGRGRDSDCVEPGYFPFDSGGGSDWR